MNCGYGEKLVLFFYGEAGESLKAEVENHLPRCAACRGELAALKAAESRLDVRREPPAAAVEAVMRAARAAVPGRRGLRFNWGEALLSGALASLFVAGFFVSSRGGPADLAWNSGLDSGLDSMEYSVYQEQSDLTAAPGDLDYNFSAVEDERLQAEVQA